MGSKQETPEKRVSKHFLSGKRVRSFKSTVYRPFRRRNGVKRSTFCTREKCHLIKFERRTPSRISKPKRRYEPKKVFFLGCIIRYRPNRVKGHLRCTHA